MYGDRKGTCKGFGDETRKEETTWKNLGVEVRIILKWIFKIGWESVV
jgi:hypothetical protein